MVKLLGHTDSKYLGPGECIGWASSLEKVTCESVLERQEHLEFSGTFLEDGRWEI